MTGQSKITSIKGVGDKRAQLFNKLGVDCVDALIHFYPRRYIDYSKQVRLCDCENDAVCCVKARVTTPPKEHFIRRNMVLYKFCAEADGVQLRVTLFNNKYLAQKIRLGVEYIFYGKISGNLLVKEMSAPEILPLDKAIIRPIYRSTANLPSHMIEKTVAQALSDCGELRDYLPDQARMQLGLLPLDSAVHNIHFPGDQSLLCAARKRLVFDELLLLQLAMRRIKVRNKNSSGFVVKRDFSDQFAAMLPYTLTNAQQRAISDALKDMSSGRQMNRLIQGDVGSGKTAVAASLAFTAVKNGRQVAVMAPTEILAEQHYKSFCKMFSGTDIRIELLTGALTPSAKREVCRRLACGDTDIVVGTHAIISDNVQFDTLGLAITDEQHRFGVAQRSALSAKGDHPHLLVMSATPIPRTLALMVYGELDVSVLDELPVGRQKISTYVVPSALHERVYNYIKKHIDAGHQGYIVCPLVEQDDENTIDLISVKQYADMLKKGPFCGYSVGMLHGKMAAAEKDSIMRRFAAGEIQLLISTTVIEVGIDVPNATVIVIENADRFGLSQLHQLRGRVGRGSFASDCILISDDRGEVSRERLQTMKNNSDGFAIAEADLKLRGPGDFFGRKQHGLPDLKIADLQADIETLELAGRSAAAIIKGDVILTAEQSEIIDRRIAQMFDSAVEMN